MNPETPAGMVRMASGQLLPASSPSGSGRPTSQKLLIVIQYYGGDQNEAEELGSLIADLERIRNHDADILIFARFDAPEFSRDVLRKLESKFDKVGFFRSRRKDATRYPFAPNQMFGDLVTLLGQVPPWRTDYYAFLNLETDCVPVHPGWITELANEYKIANAHGFFAVGHIHDNPTRHLNGVAVYATDIWGRVGGGRLTGADAQIPYDIYHANDLAQYAVDTPYITFYYQRPTITADELFKAHKHGVEPALYHGVKDGSARAAVRHKYIEHGEGSQDLAHKTVFTFYVPQLGQRAAENNIILNFWRDGWRSRGWNPVVMSLRDAVKNPRYQKFMDKIVKFPFVNDQQAHLNRFLRWLALDTMGGGLLTDFDVLPGQFTPKDNARLANGICCYASDGDTKLSAMYLDAPNSKTWLDEIEAYDPQPADKIGDNPSVTDLTIWRSNPALNEQHSHPLVELFGQAEWKKAALVHFSQSAIESGLVRGQRKSLAMETYLRGG